MESVLRDEEFSENSSNERTVSLLEPEAYETSKMRILRNYFKARPPILKWLPKYRKIDIFPDAVAGFAVGKYYSYFKVIVPGHLT
jgi:hypothetical protein